MRKLITITSMFLFMSLVAGTVFADTTQNTNNWKILKKPDGIPITSAAICDGGHSLYVGLQNGDLGCDNMSGFTKYKKPPTGPIVSIVPTIIDKTSGLGKLAYITENSVFAYNDKEPVNLGFPLNRKPMRLAYNDNTLYCKTKSDSIYKLRDGKWIIQGQNSDIFMKVAGNGSTYSINDSRTNVNSNSDKNPDPQNVGTVYNGYGQFELTTNGEIKECFSGSANDDPVTVQFVSLVYDDNNKPTNDAIYRITINGLEITPYEDRNYLFGKDYGWNGISYDVFNGVGDKRYNKTAYPILGYRYDEGNGTGKSYHLKPREISFLWRGPKLSANSGSQANVVEKIYGFQDKEQHQLLAGSTWQKDVGHKVYLPANTVPTLTKQQCNVEIDEPTAEVKKINDFNCIPNGVSVTPVVVRISYVDPDTQKKAYLPSTDDLYNHLVFFSDDEGDGKFEPGDTVLGCSPYSDSEYNYYISVLTQKETEIIVDGKRVVKYGISGPDLTSPAYKSGGRIFYVVAGHRLGLKTPAGGGTTTVTVGVELDGVYQGETQRLDDTVMVHPDLSSVELDQETKQSNLNTETGRTFKLTNGIKEIKVSSWEGNSDGEGAGYIDYVVPQEAGSTPDNAPPGVYAVFPQGLNDLQLFPDRLNPAAMHAGYYFQPTDNPVGLYADNYGINDRTAYCKTLKGKSLHAYIFDTFGRYVTYAATDTNKTTSGTDTNWDFSKHKDGYVHVRLTNWSNVPICMHGYETYNGDPENSLGVSEKDKGVFVPPMAPGDPGIDFLTNIKTAITNSDHTKYLYICGSQVCKQTDDENSYDYCRSELHFEDDGWNENATMHTHVLVPDAIEQAVEGRKNYEDYYLPVNQVEWWDEGGYHIRLMYWGVHFISWNAAGHVTKHYKDNGHDCHVEHGDDRYSLGEEFHYYTGWHSSKKAYDKITYDYDDTVTDPSIENWTKLLTCDNT